MLIGTPCVKCAVERNSETFCTAIISNQTDTTKSINRINISSIIQRTKRPDSIVWKKYSINQYVKVMWNVWWGERKDGEAMDNANANIIRIWCGFFDGMAAKWVQLGIIYLARIDGVYGDVSHVVASHHTVCEFQSAYDWVWSYIWNCICAKKNKHIRTHTHTRPIAAEHTWNMNK